jgi:hypothetical protein
VFQEIGFRPHAEPSVEWLDVLDATGSIITGDAQ